MNTPINVTSGADLIAAERRRQIEAEGWTPEHDDKHQRMQLAQAARAYIGHSYNPGRTEVPYEWPWDSSWWKPSDRVRSLVKAGALIAAEIDRLQRMAGNA